MKFFYNQMNFFCTKMKIFRTKMKFVCNKIKFFVPIFPTNYHHKKQTHKEIGDVIALKVKQTNKAKNIFNQKFKNKW